MIKLIYDKNKDLIYSEGKTQILNLKINIKLNQKIFIMIEKKNNLWK